MSQVIWLVFVVAAILEVGGDALVRKGLRGLLEEILFLQLRLSQFARRGLQLASPQPGVRLPRRHQRLDADRA